MSSETTAARSESEAQTFTVVESSFDTPPDDAQSEKLNLLRGGGSGGLRPVSASQVSPYSLQDVINR
jgi:hypothetical protein